MVAGTKPRAHRVLCDQTYLDCAEDERRETEDETIDSDSYPEKLYHTAAVISANELYHICSHLQ
jgi:hypothetical protein